jgi:nitroimidazol reductase NimA-like FMN-containing flavoprotein (pyridoxamine 5'-phosphate oxidase superfamily)
MPWEEQLVDLLLGGKYMTLATADGDGVPWVSPVVYGCDASLNFYWASGLDARHSVNVRARPEAALSIFDPAQIPNSGVQGIYVEGAASELDGAELAAAVTTFYRWRYPDPQTFQQKRRGPEEFQDVSPRRIYRLTPGEIFGLDPEGDPEHGSLLDFRVSVDIAEAFSERMGERH